MDEGKASVSQNLLSLTADVGQNQSGGCEPPSSEQHQPREQQGIEGECAGAGNLRKRGRQPFVEGPTLALCVLDQSIKDGRRSSRKL